MNKGGSMKKALLIVGLILAVTVPAFAQWGGGYYFGRTVLHRDSIDAPDFWYGSYGSAYNTSSSLELAGYNAVRADYVLTGTGASASVSLMCSNDSLWMSGDSISITKDTWKVYDLMGCKDYNFYVENIVGTTPTLTIRLTPYDKYRR